MLDYTPRQLAAFLVIATHRRKRELREQLQLAATAAQGDQKTIDKKLKELDE